MTEDLVVTALGDRRLKAVTHGGKAEWTQSLDCEVIELAGAGGASAFPRAAFALSASTSSFIYLVKMQLKW